MGIKLSNCNWDESKLIQTLLSSKEVIEIPVTGHDFETVIYFLINNGEIVYIGKSESFNIMQRLSFHRKDPKNKKVFNQVFIWRLNTEDRKKIQAIERGLIDFFMAKYNTEHSKKQSTRIKNRIFIQEYFHQL